MGDKLKTEFEEDTEASPRPRVLCPLAPVEVKKAERRALSFVQMLTLGYNRDRFH